MALYNDQKVLDDAAKKEAYDKLKKHISYIDEHGKLNEFYTAYRYLIEMENKMNEQEEQLKRYYEFFSKLSSLTPRQSSIHDIIR